VTLPTEAEWEYAARAGSTGARYGDLGRIAWYDGNSSSKTHAIGQKTANAWGLYDMLGNVWEWVNDWYDKYRPCTFGCSNPAGPSTGSDRVVRGGAYFSYANSARSALRNSQGPNSRFDAVGFRLVRSVP